jgi:hypothetical protein
MSTQLEGSAMGLANFTANVTGESCRIWPAPDGPEMLLETRYPPSLSY